MPLDKTFFTQPTISVAKQLLGCILISMVGGIKTSGKIIEVECYLQNDPASHAYVGETIRNRIMYGPAGFAYVYLIYGMHNCFNVVTGNPGLPEAILIRALEPLEGIRIMQERRHTTDLKNLCGGPAKLAQALGITVEHNKLDLSGGLIFFEHGKVIPDNEIQSSPRIGISKAKEDLLRFFVVGSPFVSHS